MDHRKKINMGLSLIATLILLGLLFKTFVNKPDIAKKIEDLRKETSPKLDSFNKKLNAEDRFFDSIKYLINSGRLDEAQNVINQLLDRDPKSDRLHVLKGMVFEGRLQYDSAFNEYNFVISKTKYSNALDKRADLYFKLGKYQEALDDYRKEYDINYDYSFKLGQTFEMIKQKDSALKYYRIYLEHYPDSILLKKVDLLSKQ